MTDPTTPFIARAGGRDYDLSRPIDISIPVTSDDQVNAFHLPRASFAPFQMGSFIGSVELGGPVRCDVVTLAPHGNGTHTECVGHIAGQTYSLIDCLKQQLVTALLITADISDSNCVTVNDVKGALARFDHDALIIRTLPNDASKRTRLWSGNEPPFVSPDAMQNIVDAGVKHLLIDLPSVDPEEDEGALLSHHIFWSFPDQPRTDATITEMIYVPEEVVDGSYLLAFNAAAFDGDAAPSRPTLYASI